LYRLWVLSFLPAESTEGNKASLFVFRVVPSIGSLRMSATVLNQSLAACVWFWINRLRLFKLICLRFNSEKGSWRAWSLVEARCPSYWNRFLHGNLECRQLGVSWVTWPSDRCSLVCSYGMSLDQDRLWNNLSTS
jgi:hypothetical protein